MIGTPVDSDVVQKNGPKPIYLQLSERLRADVVAGRYQPNDVIPSELELSRRHGISRMTARAVVTELVNEGLLHRVQGKGTFVVEPKIPARSLAYRGIREQLESMGFATKTKLVDFRTEAANHQLATVFGVAVGEPLVFAKRLRLVDDKPISLHLSYVPEALAPTLGPDRLEDEQLCVILARDFALAAETVSETLESTLASTAEAELLGVEQLFPLLLLSDTYQAATGRVFEYTKVLFRGDKVKLQFEYGPGR